MRPLCLLFAGCLLSVAALPAAVIPFGSDLLNESNNLTGANVAIRPHPVWASLAPYQWISYANTGAGGWSPPNTDLRRGPTAVFYEYLPAGAGEVTLAVYADDTAAVYLIDARYPAGLLLQAANPRQDGACAKGPIGCEWNEGWLYSFLVDHTGPAMLRFDVYQRGGGPFGLLYGGTVAENAEATTTAMLLIGLAALYGAERRRRWSRACAGLGRPEAQRPSGSL